MRRMSGHRPSSRIEAKSLLSGLISAASDNDPTTVGTIAVAGATTLYALEWVLVLVVPMLAVVQMLASRLAAVTHLDLQSAIRRRYGAVVASVTMIALVAVNIVTLGADLQAGAAALNLISGVAQWIWVVPIAVVLAALLSWGTFDRVRIVFALMPLAFLAYVAAAFVAHPNWGAVARGFIPHLEGGRRTSATLLALFGTLLTAYAYLWQTVEVAADRPPRRKVLAIQLASLPGVLFTFAILWFILIATAATLGVHHHQIETAQDAAKALAPFAGRAAPIVFAVGLLGSSLLAVPVIAAANSGAVAVTLGWGGSIDAKPKQAKRYYAVLYASLAIAAGICFAGVPTITLLYVASIAGGIATPVTLAPLMLLVRDRSVMQNRRAPLWLAAAGWIVTAIVTAAAIASIV